MRFGLVFLLAVTLGAFSGCGGKKVDPSDPKALFEDAQDDIKSDRYAIALEKLRKVKNKFPYSKYATTAQLRIADVYFKQEAYAQAAASYEVFRDLHPKHAKASYAMYQVGESYFMDMPSTVARDMNAGYQALTSFENYMQTYPTGEHSKQAKERIQNLNDTLAEKELYVANFYFSDGKKKSAAMRFQKILDLYPKSKHIKEAKEKLNEIRNDKD